MSEFDFWIVLMLPAVFQYKLNFQFRGVICSLHSVLLKRSIIPKSWSYQASAISQLVWAGDDKSHHWRCILVDNIIISCILLGKFQFLGKILERLCLVTSGSIR